jgi:hypothetical protein
MQEVNAMACDIRAGQRPRGPALREPVLAKRCRDGLTETGTEP